jgi:hypothetical protein
MSGYHSEYLSCYEGLNCNVNILGSSFVAADIISCENHPKRLYILNHPIEADSANVRATFDCMQQVGTINEAPVMIAIRSRESLRSIVARGAEPYAGLTNTRTSRLDA